MPVSPRHRLVSNVLSDADRDNLYASGLTEETIRANGLHTEVSALVLAGTLNRDPTSNACLGGLVIPYRDLQGAANCYARVRPHYPRTDKKGKPIKYESPVGSELRAYYPVASLPLLLDGTSAVFITEGEKKALALSQLALAVVGVAGIWCGCKKGTTDLIDDLAALYLTGRVVYVVFDTEIDPRSRADVEKARRRLAGALRRAGAKVVHLHLPGDGKAKVGVDDFLLANSADAFVKLVEGASSKSRTRFTAAELMTMNLTEPCCLVEGIVTEGCNLLVSRPKLGKSWWALQLAIETATGGTFLDREVAQGDILYLALEDNPRRLKKRLARLLGDNPAPERLTIATSWPRMDEGGKEEIQRWIDDADDPKLVIVDTLAKIKKRAERGGDRYADDYLDLGEFKELADDNEVPLLLNHHDRKAQGTDIIDDVSGTLGISGAADTILLLKRERGQHDACLHVTGRDIDESELAMGWDASACRWSLLGSADYHRLSEQRKKILKALEGGPKTTKQVAEATDMTEANTKQLLHQMRKAGQVSSNEGVYHAVRRPFAPDNRPEVITPIIP